MKVYKQVTIDIETGVIEQEDSFEYSGPIAQCSGGASGGGSNTTGDPVYNARVAAISESQQWMAEEYFTYWQDVYKPMETEQVKANRELIPEQVKGEKAKIKAEIATLEANTSLLPWQKKTAIKALETEYQELDAKQELLPQQTTTEMSKLKAAKGVYDAAALETSQAAPVMADYYKKALSGVNINERVSQARAGVQQDLSKQNEIQNRDMARLGINPDSGVYAAGKNQKAVEGAAAMAGAGTAAKTAAEAENFERLSGAVNTYKKNYGVGG